MVSFDDPLEEVYHNVTAANAANAFLLSRCEIIKREQGNRWHLSVLPTLVLARLANAAAPLLLRSQARRKAYRARSAETKGTAQLVLRTQARRKEKGLVKIPRIFLAPPLLTTLAPTGRVLPRKDGESEGS